MYILHQTPKITSALTVSALGAEMARITNMIHGVKSVTVQRKTFADFECMTIMLTLEDGSEVGIDAFSAKVLAISEVPAKCYVKEAA